LFAGRHVTIQGMSTLPIKYPNDHDWIGNPQQWRGLALLTLTIIAILVLYCALRFPAPSQQQMTLQQMFDLIKAGRVVTIVNVPDPSSGIRYLTGVYHPAGTEPSSSNGRAGFRVPVDLQLDPNVLNELRQAGYTGTIETATGQSVAWPLFLNVLPVVVFFSLLFVILRRLLKAISG
jgi:ATP-dependent Zn protease